MNDFSTMLKLFMETEPPTPGSLPPTPTAPVSVDGAKNPSELFTAYVNEMTPLWNALEKHLEASAVELQAIAANMKKQIGTGAFGKLAPSKVIKKAPTAPRSGEDFFSSMRGNYSGPGGRFQATKPSAEPGT